MIANRGKAAGLGEPWVLGKERTHDLICLYPGRGIAGAVVLVGATASDGDPLALDLDGAAGRWLELAIADPVNALNPAVAVPGGPTAEWGRVLIGAVDGLKPPVVPVGSAA